MTGQVLLTIIMLLFFIIPLILHYHNKVILFKDRYGYDVLSTVFFLISIVYLVLTLIVFILNHWNTPIF